MARPKVIENPIRVSTVVSEKHFEFLQLMVVRMSCQEKRPLTMSEIIRRAVEQCYPLPKDKQMYLFTERE